MMDMDKKANIQQGNKKNKKGSILVLAGIIITAGILLILYPENREPSINAAFNLFKELIFILPAVMVLMGLFTVWVSRETVIKYLGHAAGVKGLIIALIMGMMPTGPLYVAFPMASMLLKKGARVANIIIFLSAWACIKLPQELVELRFMGVEFMAVRLSFTIVMVVVMGLLIEKLDGLSKHSESQKIEG
jgi:uncharacterized membrane protein YraQ (UPF0718 family)